MFALKPVYLIVVSEESKELMGRPFIQRRVDFILF